jgi:subtilisin-like proprotein convertase family protein
MGGGAPFPENMILTGVISGPFGGDRPKAVEIYIVNDIPDLSLYGIGIANDGNGTDGQEFIFPAVSATAGSFIWVSQFAPEFLTWFGFAQQFSGLPSGLNGNDAVELYFNSTVIDVYGDPNVDGNGQVWEYTKGWGSRVSGTAPSSIFNPADWTYSGKDGIDNELTNATAALPMPVSAYIPPAGGGPFTTINPGTGVFQFIGSGALGTYIVDVTYIPPPASMAPPITLPYSVSVNPSGGGFLACTSPLMIIPDDGVSTQNTTLTVSGGPVTIFDLNVFLDLKHTSTGDIQVFLRSPAMTTVELTGQNGEMFPDLYSTVIFDDEAAASITTIMSSGGVFRPEGSLTAFDGEDSNGVWTLSVIDLNVGEAGCLGSWCLAFDGATVIDPMTPCPSGNISICVTPGVNIPDAGGILNGTFASRMTVAGGPGLITDMDLFVDIRHPNPADLDIFLQSPLGTMLEVSSDNGGGNADAYSTVIFDDEAGTSILSLALPGVYSPENGLTIFDGEDANGLWILTLTDDAIGGDGCIASWCLAFSTGVSDPGGSCTPGQPGSTFSSGVLITPIPDGNPTGITVPITVPAGEPLINDVRVRMDITHPFIGNIQLVLDAPSASFANLSIGQGFDQDDMGVIFSDSAPSSITTFFGTPGNPLPFPEFMPQTSLTVFDTQDPTGMWILTVTDSTGGSTGFFNEWALAFNGDTSSF